MKHVDLHMHTIYSDGFSEPRQVVRECARHNQDVISITDHDITSGIIEASDEAKKLGMKLIPGVEISTEPYHILGYGININDLAFQSLLERSRKMQEEISRRRTVKIYDYGIPITIAKVKEQHPYSRIGKLNVLTTIMKDPECIKYINGKSLDDLMVLLMKKGGVAYDVGEKDQLSPKEAIRGIHYAGGLAIIAHPFKEVKDMEELNVLIGYGLDGIEIQPNYGEKNVPFIEFAKKNNLLMTYGSDYHGGPMVFRKMLSRNGNVLDESVIDKLGLYKFKE